MAPGLSSIDCYTINEVLNCLEAGLVTRQSHLATSQSSAPPGYKAGGRAPHTHVSFTITLQQHMLDKGEYMLRPSIS